MTEAARRTWTVRDVLTWTTTFFRDKGFDTPRLEAELLLAHALGCDRVRLYVDFLRPLTEEERGTYRVLVERRARGEPSAYILGTREFYGRPFRVDPRAFIPRPETELLVDRVLEAVPPDAEGEVLDLCSGSGCVGVTLACERPGLRVTAVELHPDAAALARENAGALGVEDRYDQRVGDLFAPLAGRGPFLAVATNPPYVADGEIPGLQVEVRDHEPRAALAGGADGGDVARRILDEAQAWLVPGGLLAMEHGGEQGEVLRAHAEAAGWAAVEVHRDVAGLDRILTARRP